MSPWKALPCALRCLCVALAAIPSAFADPPFAEPPADDAADVVIAAREGVRAPNGYARPPFHIRPNVTNTTPSGLTPARVRHAYGFDQIANGGQGQTIAIVDAYDHPSIESDLAVFNATFGLPACTSSNGC